MDTAFVVFFLIYNRFIIFKKCKRMNAWVEYINDTFGRGSTQESRKIFISSCLQGWLKTPYVKGPEPWPIAHSVREEGCTQCQGCPYSFEHNAAEAFHDQHHHPDSHVMLPKGKERRLPARPGLPILLQTQSCWSFPQSTSSFRQLCLAAQIVGQGFEATSAITKLIVHVHYSQKTLA